MFNFAVRQAYIKESDAIMYYTLRAADITRGWIKKLFVNRLPSNMTAYFTKRKGSVAHSLRKQPTFCDATTGFPAKWRLSDDFRNSILMMSLLSSGRCFWLVVSLRIFASTNEKRNRNLGNDASSVWNFCARSSGVISYSPRSLTVLLLRARPEPPRYAGFIS